MRLMTCADWAMFIGNSRGRPQVRTGFVLRRAAGRPKACPSIERRLGLLRRSGFMELM